MCFEVVLQIVCAALACFGVYSLIYFVSETWFFSDNIAVCVEIDTIEAVKNIENYVKEACRIPRGRCGGVTVLVRQRYAAESLLRELRARGIRYFIIYTDDESQ